MQSVITDGAIDADRVAVESLLTAPFHARDLLDPGLQRNRVPAKPVGGPYWRGKSVARGVAILASGRAVVVDAFGGLHTFTAR